MTTYTGADLLIHNAFENGVTVCSANPGTTDTWWLCTFEGVEVVLP